MKAKVFLYFLFLLSLCKAYVSILSVDTEKPHYSPGDSFIVYVTYSVVPPNPYAQNLRVEGTYLTVGVLSQAKTQYIGVLTPGTYTVSVPFKIPKEGIEDGPYTITASLSGIERWEENGDLKEEVVRAKGSGAVIVSTPPVLSLKVENRIVYPGENLSIQLCNAGGVAREISLKASSNTTMNPDRLYIRSLSEGECESLTLEVTSKGTPTLALQYSDAAGQHYNEVRTLPVEIKDLPRDFSITISELPTGKKSRVEIELHGLKNAELESEAEDLFFIPLEVNINEGTNLVWAYTNLSPGVYLLPFSLTWEEEGRQFSTTTKIPVEIEGEEDVILYSEEKNTTIGKPSEVSIVVANAGLDSLHSITIKVSVENATLLSGDTVFIGTLDKDDYTSEKFTVVPEGKSWLMKVDVYYRDSLGNSRTFTKTLSFISQKLEENTSLWQYIIPSLIVLAVVFYLLKKK